MAERSDDRLMMEKLARALKVYANPRHWKEDDWGCTSVFWREYGKPGVRARNTLKRYQEYLASGVTEPKDGADVDS